MEQYENNSYNSYSILSTNLTNGTTKFKKVYRMSSPVIIQSFGKNNFVVELKYKTNNKNNNNNNNNDDYEFIEKELKKTKKNKAYTTYTEISNEESLFFGAQKPNQRYYKDSTNFTNYCPDNITTNNDNYIYEPNYNYQMNDNEDIDSLSHPNDRIYIPKKNSNKMNKSINDLKYQRFCASFISKNPNSNQNSRKKRIIHKNENSNNYVLSNINSNEKKEREHGISKSKNQLQDFNIDKLKEIGDNFALRYMNKNSQLAKNNLQYKQNANTINNMTILSEKKDNHNGIINKIIMFDKKRKESKNKINLINKTEIKRKPGEESNINDVYDNKNIYEVKKDIDNYNFNNLSTRTKILNMNKNDSKVINCPSPYTKKIKLNNIIRRKKFTINPVNNTKLKEEFTANYFTIKDKNNTYLENKDSTNIEQNNNKDFYQYNTKISNTSNNNNNFNININNNINNSEKTHKIYKKVQNVNSRIIMDKNKINDNLQNNNINHNYFESINIKNNNKIKKTEYSFNNVILPVK